MKADVEHRKTELITILSAYCDQHLDKEYKELCMKLIAKMSRKRNVPFASGRIEIWAAAIIYAIGQINFLFDQSFLPYNSPDEICSYFHTSKSTTSQKARIIRDMFHLGYYNEEFSTKKMQDSDPMKNMVMTIDGFIVPKDMLDKDMH